MDQMNFKLIPRTEISSKTQDPKSLVTIKEKVKYLLMNKVETRDCDKLMVLTFYLYFHNIQAGSYPQLKTWLLGEKIPTFSSIIRMRTWLQSNVPETRGPKWQKRYNKAATYADRLSAVAEHEGKGPIYDGNDPEWREEMGLPPV